jgi:hypothetical protein
MKVLIIDIIGNTNSGWMAAMTARHGPLVARPAPATEGHSRPVLSAVGPIPMARPNVARNPVSVPLVAFCTPPSRGEALRCVNEGPCSV